MKNLIIVILFIICIVLTFYLLNGSFCHIDYIKPSTTDLIPSFLGVI